MAAKPAVRRADSRVVFGQGPGGRNLRAALACTLASPPTTSELCRCKLCPRPGFGDDKRRLFKYLSRFWGWVGKRFSARTRAENLS